MGEPSRKSEVTQVLNAAAGGDPRAAARLLPLLYDELHTLAHIRMGRIPPGGTLQTTALVHEAYLRLVEPVDPGWNGRSHFFGAAASAMRDILVEQARRKAAAKRGGDRRQVGLDEAEIAFDGPTEDVVALDEALSRLEAQDPRKAQIVNFRYFAGLSQAETAALLNVSERTIQRDWRYIKAWLRKELQGGAHRERSDG